MNKRPFKSEEAKKFSGKDTHVTSRNILRFIRAYRKNWSAFLVWNICKVEKINNFANKPSIYLRNLH